MAEGAGREWTVGIRMPRLAWWLLSHFSWLEWWLETPTGEKLAPTTASLSPGGLEVRYPVPRSEAEQQVLTGSGQMGLFE